MTRLRAALDNSLEIVTGLARLLAVVDLLGALGLLGLWVWTSDLRFVGLAGLALAFAAFAGWFGFWLFGNEEWRRGQTDDRAA